MNGHFLRDDDLDARERAEVLDLAVQMRERPRVVRCLEGPRTVAVLFDKPSTRTRVSFSVGIADMGGMPLVLDTAAMQLGRGESIADTARVLSRQVSAIVWRTFAQTNLEEMALWSEVPVINALTNELHPCQLLADLLTIRDEFGVLAGLRVVFLGDIGNNVASSTMLACASEGMHLTLSGPESAVVDPEVFTRAVDLCAESGGSVTIDRHARSAADEADVLITDTWTSMGDEPLSVEEAARFLPYSLDATLLDVASPGAIVLHCLPAYRGREIAADVIDGGRSRVWQQAENRLHVQKALLTHLLQPRFAFVLSDA